MHMYMSFFYHPLSRTLPNSDSLFLNSLSNSRTLLENMGSDLEYDLAYVDCMSESDTSSTDEDEEVSFVRVSSDSESSEGPASVFVDGFEPWWNDEDQDQDEHEGPVELESVALALSTVADVNEHNDETSVGVDVEEKNKQNSDRLTQQIETNAKAKNNQSLASQRIRLREDAKFAARASADFSHPVFRDRNFPTPPSMVGG
jgi:hypothetical protein